MHIVRLLPIAVLILTAWLAQPAAAVLPFYKVFEAEYLENHPDQEFVDLVTKGTNRCYICHQGKKRKNHNPFGDHLVELLDRRKDARNKEKILAAIKKVVKLPFDPDNPEGETYLDRIQAGKWPGGEFEELKKDPPEEEGSEDQ